jgi:AcrR family transcriptional regulator
MAIAKKKETPSRTRERPLVRIASLPARTSHGLPGRPRADGRPPITRRQVLAAAATLISERGFGETSIRMIADFLNARASTVFHHFPSKDLILDELVSELFRVERHFVQQVVEADLPPEVALYKLIFEDLLVGAADNLVLQRIFLLPDLRSGRFPLAAEHWNELVTAYANTIAIGQKRGIFVACDRRAAAEGLFNLLSTPLIGFASPAQPTASVLASTLANIGVRGILKDPTRIEDIARQAAAVKLVMQPFKF